MEVIDSVFTKHHLFETDLFAAARKGIEAKCLLLIDIHSVEVDCRNADRQTPLQISSMYGYHKLAQLLIHRGANADASSWSGMTSLHWAAYHGDVEMVKLLIDRGSADVEQANGKGFTPLQYAAFGSEQAALALLERGARVRLEMPPALDVAARLAKRFDYTALVLRWRAYREVWVLCGLCVTSKSPARLLPRELVRELAKFLV